MASGLLVLILLSQIACNSGSSSLRSKAGQRQEYHFSGQFDSFTIILDEGKQPELIKKLGQKLDYYHQLFTPYEEYPGLENLAYVNREASLRSVELDPELNSVLELAWSGSKASHNAFNPALGELVLVWRELRDQIQAAATDLSLPSSETLKAALSSSDLESIDYDSKAGSIHFNNPHSKLDLGGVAKGWAVEALAQMALKEGGDHLLISVGGNVRAVGRKANGEPWRVLIQDPFKGSKINFPQLIIELEDEALVTSGLYERYFEFQGKRYAHILDPESGWPQDQYISISVLAPDSGLADLLATALFNLDLKSGKALVEAYGVEALWIDQAGNIEQTEGFKKRLLPD